MPNDNKQFLFFVITFLFVIIFILFLFIFFCYFFVVIGLKRDKGKNANWDSRICLSNYFFSLYCFSLVIVFLLLFFPVIVFRLLLFFFSDTNNPDRSLWPPEKTGSWQVGDYPNDIKFFKKYFPKIKQMFTMHEHFIQKAQERLTIFSILITWTVGYDR